MLGHRQMGFDDYTQILRKRWWIVLIPAVVFTVGVYLYSLTISNQFTSRTLVLVEQQQVPDTYVKSASTDNIGGRLGTMQEQILSRTRLQPIIEKFHLYEDEGSKTTMEDKVDRFRKSIVVTPIQSLVTTRVGEMPGFSITFTGNDAKLTQQICQEILSMFIEQSIKDRINNVEGTTDFLVKTLEKAKKDLDDQDAKLADFKRKYVGSLPGTEGTDMQIMMATSSQLDAVTSQLNRAQQDKAYIDSMLAQQVSAWQLAQKSTGGSSSTTAGGMQDPQEKELADMQRQLVAMKSHYTDDHPDVVKLKADIAALKQKIADSAPPKDPGSPTTDTAKATEPPGIQQLRFQSHQAEVTIREKTREQAQLRGQLGAAQGRLSMSPGVEQQYKEITRDYQTALQFYNDTLAKKNQSEMATSLQRAQQGEQFRVMDPPNMPEKPSYPDRPAFAGAGLGAGLALGFGLTLLLELRDKTLRTENDVEQFLGLPTLAMVPVIGDGKDVKSRTGRPVKDDGAKLREAAHV